MKVLGISQESLCLHTDARKKDIPPRGYVADDRGTQTIKSAVSNAVERLPCTSFVREMRGIPNSCGTS
eukprot:6213998-Pleurochrysis_carterae.AAC.2